MFPHQLSSFRFPLSSCLRAILALLVIRAGLGEAVAQNGIPGYVVLPIELRDRGNQATVGVEVNGQRTRLLVDTGAPATVLDEKFYRNSAPKTGEATQDELPPELRKATDANGQKASFALVSSFKVGGVDLGKRAVILTDLRPTMSRYNSSHPQAAVSGLLGEDVFYRYAAIIDWRRRGIYLNTDPSKRLKLGAGLVAAGWTAVPMAATSGHHFSVQATVEGKPVRLIVDTGATFTSFVPDVVKFSQMVYHIGDSVGTRLQTAAVSMSMINSNAVAYPARIENWKIGNYVIRSSMVTVHPMPATLTSERSSGEGPMLGLLGAELLANNSAIIDIAGSTLYLKPAGR